MPPLVSRQTEGSGIGSNLLCSVGTPDRMADRHSLAIDDDIPHSARDEFSGGASPIEMYQLMRCFTG